MSLQFGDDMCSQVVTPSTVGELLVVVARSSKVAATGSHSHTAALRDFADEKLERKTRHKHHDDVNTFDLTHT